jgi:hypothetical protein
MTPMILKILSSLFISILALTSTALSKEIYLDKLNNNLDALYNAYDEMCRGAPGGSKMSDYGCKERSKVSAAIKKMGCYNIYPATNPQDTSYWKCKR